MQIFFKQLWERKIARFVVVGCFNTAFDVGLLLAILKIFDWPPLVANSLSVSAAITVSYFLNHRIVFRQTEAYSIKKYVRFFLVTGLGIIFIQDSIIYIATDKLWVISKAMTFTFLGHDFHSRTIEILVAKLIGVILGLAWNFLLYKYVVFRISKKTKQADEEKIVIAWVLLFDSHRFC